MHGLDDDDDDDDDEDDDDDDCRNENCFVVSTQKYILEVRPM
jgi:hypothetical protein